MVGRHQAMWTTNPVEFHGKFYGIPKSIINLLDSILHAPAREPAGQPVAVELKGRTSVTALQAVAEVVHDIHCKESKFQRPETPAFLHSSTAWPCGRPTTKGGSPKARPFSNRCTPVSERKPREPLESAFGGA